MKTKEACWERIVLIRRTVTWYILVSARDETTGRRRRNNVWADREKRRHGHAHSKWLEEVGLVRPEMTVEMDQTHSWSSTSQQRASERGAERSRRCEIRA